MKENELRIGNYAYFMKNDSICEILGIDRFGFVESLSIGQNELNAERHVGDFIPIELNEEWLLKAGFKKAYNEYHHLSMFKHSNLKILLRDQGNGEYTPCTNKEYLYSKGVRIKYVHQLQNLYFALVGEDLPLSDFLR